MSKSLAASVVCFLPLLAACPNDQSPCKQIGTDVLVEVSESSKADDVGSCKVPPAFRLGALGCNTALSYSADLCVVEYDLMCIGNVDITLDVKQAQDDGIVGTLHKVDSNKNCTLDLDITIKTTPAPILDAGTK